MCCIAALFDSKRLQGWQLGEGMRGTLQWDGGSDACMVRDAGEKPHRRALCDNIGEQKVLLNVLKLFCGRILGAAGLLWELKRQTLDTLKCLIVL